MNTGKNYEYDLHGRKRINKGDSRIWLNYGNIKQLQRYGRKQRGDVTSSFGLVDDMTLQYTGNQLMNVTDAGAFVSLSESSDFKKYSNSNPGYAYNKNGAMTKDLNKGISSISYNTLNLPQVIDVKNPVGEGRNTYTYAANGKKLKLVQQWNSNYSTTPTIGSAINTTNLNQTKTTEYVGNIVYEQVNNQQIKKTLYFDGGYAQSGEYYFYLRNHIGSVAVVAKEDGSVVQNVLYYPFGAPLPLFSNERHVQPYKFGEKEYDMMHGLNLMDFAARYYDAAVGRFMTPDPLAEKYYSISPYAYCNNNPMRFVDPTGKDWLDFLQGTVQSIGHNLSWGIASGGTKTVSNANHYNAGRRVGDVISAAIGIYETIKGGAELIGGVGATVASGGSAAVVAVPVSAAGVIEATHGIGTVVTAIKSMTTREGQVSEASSSNGSEKSNTSSGNKNSPHANQKAKEAAGQKYQEAKSQYDELNSKPNKTPDDKKQLKKLENQVNHWKRKQDFSGENHNQNAKGNR